MNSEREAYPNQQPLIQCVYERTRETKWKGFKVSAQVLNLIALIETYG
jgi:hypothetical protein